MLISETHFTDRSYFIIPSYSIYHTHHQDAGTAIIIKNKISHYEQPKYDTNELQATKSCRLPQSIALHDTT